MPVGEVVWCRHRQDSGFQARPFPMQDCGREWSRPTPSPVAVEQGSAALCFICLRWVGGSSSVLGLSAVLCLYGYRGLSGQGSGLCCVDASRLGGSTLEGPLVQREQIEKLFM